MTPDHWAEVERLYHAALARDVGERVAFLRETCTDDVALRREVELGSTTPHEERASG